MRNDFLLAFAYREKGDWRKILNDLKRKVPISEEEIHASYRKLKGDAILFRDPDYPSKLEGISYPPFCLFTAGNKDLLKAERILGVVGSRNCSDYGKRMAEKILEELLEKDPSIVLCSGCAQGADAVAMRTAMKRGTPVIGVSGAGIDSVYPSSCQDIYEYCRGKKGLLLSEYPLETPPDSDHFPMRNRLLVGLCDALLVIEGEEKSGTSISVNYAIDQGKDVLSIPRNADDSKTLTNKLIRDGASPALSGEDVLSAFSSCGSV